MTTARRGHHSYEDYLQLLRQNEAKFEFCDGEIFAMAGGTLAHGELGSAVNAALRNNLSGSRRVFSSDDRGEKLSHDKQLPSLKAVLLLSHRRLQITVVSRTDQGWNVQEFRAGEKLTLSEPGLLFDVDDVYRGIALEVD